MKLLWHDAAWEAYLYWHTHDKQVVKRIHLLIKDIQRNGYAGIGKPEPLKANLQSWWSRRIDAEHRLVYRICDDVCQIIYSELGSSPLACVGIGGAGYVRLRFFSGHGGKTPLPSPKLAFLAIIPHYRAQAVGL